VNDAQIKRMAERFLSWKLPDDFMPDAGISFKPYSPLQTPGSPHWPVGTNLFNAQQAEEMVRHMVEAMPPRNNPHTRGEG
jgi:hypothetical protein